MKCKQCNKYPMEEFGCIDEEKNHRYVFHCDICGCLLIQDIEGITGNIRNIWKPSKWNAYDNTITALKLLRDNIKTKKRSNTKQYGRSVHTDNYDEGIDDCIKLINEMVGE